MDRLATYGRDGNYRSSFTSSMPVVYNSKIPLLHASHRSWPTSSDQCKAVPPGRKLQGLVKSTVYSRLPEQMFHIVQQKGRNSLVTKAQSHFGRVRRDTFGVSGLADWSLMRPALTFGHALIAFPVGIACHHHYCVGNRIRICRSNGIFQRTGGDL